MQNARGPYTIKYVILWSRVARSYPLLPLLRNITRQRVTQSQQRKRSGLRAAINYRDRNMTDHEYHYFAMNAIRFPLSIMNIIIYR